METIGKFRRFKESGVLAVNMETYAVFALAKYRNIEVASLQVISDILNRKPVGCKRLNSKRLGKL